MLAYRTSRYPLALLSHTRKSVRHCKQRLGQPLQRLACGLASGVAGDHVAVLPSPLVLDRRGRRSCGHHPPRHADAAAVSVEVFAQAGSSSSGTNPVGQRLAGQAEHRSGGIGGVRRILALSGP